MLASTQQLGTTLSLPWPASGEAAMAVEPIGVVQSASAATPAPMASTAKIMTALLVLEDHPLAINEPGPVLTVSRADVATYLSERNANESVVPVVAGEQLSEYQLLQGLLLPSGSNLAAMLATWDQGSVAAFITRMNARAASLGMAATHFADVSGFSPASISIPADLIKVAQTAMALPVFAQIVAQQQASLPVAGIVHNLNSLLGQNGVVGVKTGHTDQAGGCLVFAADATIDGQPVRVYGAVMGQPNALSGAFAAAVPLLNAMRAALHLRPVVHRDDVVAHYSTAWGEGGPIVAAKAVNWLLMDGATVSRHTTINPIPATLPAGSRVGTLSLESGSQRADVPLIIEAAINGPELSWRLTRGLS